MDLVNSPSRVPACADIIDIIETPAEGGTRPNPLIRRRASSRHGSVARASQMQRRLGNIAWRNFHPQAARAPLPGTTGQGASSCRATFASALSGKSRIRLGLQNKGFCDLVSSCTSCRKHAFRLSSAASFESSTANIESTHRAARSNLSMTMSHVPVPPCLAVQ
jgi:hypothetical protein